MAMNSCLSIMKKATSIGCREDHLFCAQCIERQFASVNFFNCPQCREGQLSRQTLHSSKAVDRLIRKLQVRCKLSQANGSDSDGGRQQSKSSQKEEMDGEGKCEWVGALGDLSDHIKNHCPLSPMKCDHCNVDLKRYQCSQHEDECPEKKVDCELGCS